jgi:type IV pilus assembly protein PilE
MKSRGFSLIELMITVVIVTILASIAIPNYQDHVRRGRRGAAQSFMMEVANREAQYLLDARNFAVGAAALTTLGITVPAEVASHYTVTIGPAAPTLPPSFTITATPTGAQAIDGAMTLNNQGAKTLNGNPKW